MIDAKIDVVVHFVVHDDSSSSCDKVGYDIKFTLNGVIIEYLASL